MSERPAAAAERFVGRGRELQELDEAYVAAVSGQGRSVVVSGEAGIGKTRLCELLLDRARQSGLRAILARCWDGGGAPPLWPWQPIVEEMCGVEAAGLLAADTGQAGVDPDRFTRFAALADRLAESCAAAPTCLVIDDVHVADPGALLLVRFLARSLHRRPLLLVLTRRDGEPAPECHEASLLAEVEADATPLVLSHFDQDETAEFLDLFGLGDLDPALVATVHKVTDGNPLFLRRVAALGRPQRADAIPAGLRLAIDEALARLDPATQRVLRVAAVLGAAVAVHEVASVADVSPAMVLAVVDAAALSGVAEMDGGDRFRFSHELVRSALVEALPPQQRLDTHARIAALIGAEGPTTSSDRLARRAHHALAAAARSADDARQAVVACQAAARAMMGRFAYERADELLSEAVALHDRTELGEPSARLLVEWAQAALHGGQMIEARRRFDRAACVAEEANDPVVFAEAALGLGGHWVNEHRAPVERSRVLGLQRAALAGLPDGEVVLSCRLEVRLTAEAVFDGGPRQPVFAALEAARRRGDPLALAEALSLTHHVMLIPEHRHARLPLADELIRVASEAGHGVLGLMGLCWRAVDLFNLGDERALRAAQELRERAQALRCQSILYIANVMDVMLLIGSGRLKDAEAAATRAYELGTAVGEVDALGYFSAHIMAICWLQGREAEIADAAEEMATSPTLIQAEFSVRAGAVLLAARAGRVERARAMLDRLTADGLAALPQSSTWGPGMVAVVEAAAALDDAGIAREAYDLLLPFADMPMIASVGVVCLGSTERTLGVAARTFGALDRAIDHLERAITANRQRVNLPPLTIAQADLAETLMLRDAPGDRARARSLFAEAIDRADDMGMQRRADRWRERLASLLPRGPSDSPSLSGGAVGATGRRGHIYKDGGRWTVVLDDQRIRVPDLLGMRYLAELLTHPGQLIPALTLASDGVLASGSPHQEVLDDAARDHYAARIRELTEDLAAAEADNDIARAEKLRLEFDQLVEELEAATGLAGRTRTFVDPTERARTAVRKAIKRALDIIDDANPAIAQHLRTTITTGITCTYAPDPRAPVTWSTHAPDHEHTAPP